MGNSMYRHGDVPGITLQVSVTRCMGDSDVSFSVHASGRQIYSESDPHVGGMAFSRDGKWMYVQTGYGHEREHKTIDARNGEVVAGALHPGSMDEVVLATEFRGGGGHLGEVGDGRFTGSKFESPEMAIPIAKLDCIQKLGRWIYTRFNWDEVLAHPAAAISDVQCGQRVAFLEMLIVQCGQSRDSSGGGGGGGMSLVTALTTK